MLKVGQQTILNWEKGKEAIPAFQLERLSEIYKIPIENIRIKKSCTAQN
nr:MAG TPA: SOS-response transcriptional repressor [Caudoviricetes sp.]